MWQHHLVKPGTKIRLNAIDAGGTKAFSGNKEKAEAVLSGLHGRLSQLQELLYAEGKHKILIVLQAMDTAGKDSTIRCVFQGVNPQGVDVVRFKVPTLEELGHDYLWRVHPHTPVNGKITIFNRSHYEDVVTVGVHNLVAAPLIEKRYGHINDFERMLTDEGAVILKFFLHISKDEQKRRITERLDDPKKYWKFTLSDIHERKSWSKYITAYERAISRTSTPWAPWCVVPANKKWYRNLIITQSIVDYLEQMRMHYPKLAVNPKSVYFR